MNESKWFYHPIFVFILSIIALGTSLFLYIYWYVEVSTGLDTIVKKFKLDPDQVLESQTWVVILVLSILVGIILLGIFNIFFYNQKMLQLYRMQRNFINNFTHELKTPVTSLKLYLETFAKYELPREDQLKYIQYMIQDVSRLSENTNRILDLAKIEGGSYGGEFIFKELVSTVKRFYDENEHVFRDCEITINSPSQQSFSYAINVPLFEMLLMNLTTNAIKYNGTDMPRIDITFTKQKHKLFIHFEDNGIGLDRKNIKKIFRKFYQVGQADNMSAKGSGIGLYLVEHIVRMHGGRITAESDGVGKGSLFTLILPL